MAHQLCSPVACLQALASYKHSHLHDAIQLAKANFVSGTATNSGGLMYLEGLRKASSFSGVFNDGNSGGAGFAEFTCFETAAFRCRRFIIYACMNCGVVRQACLVAPLT